MIDKIIFATSNAGKIREARMILADMNLPVYSLKELNIHSDPEENGETFEENAIIKVRDIMGRKESENAIILADDSGLVIDYLGGEPGVRSARYLGHDTSYDYKNKVIMERLEPAEDSERTARYICVIAAGLPDGTVYTAEGVMEGEIGKEARGEGGFGYDPIFWLPEYQKTAAELSAEEKNQISHRGKALRAIREKLAK